MAVQLVWYKRDLRVADHQPLFNAALRGPVLPLYIIEPAIIHAEDYSERHYRFIRQTLLESRKRLAALGMPLVVRVGAALEVLADIHTQHSVGCIWAHEETGNDLTYQRDIAVRRWARGQGIPLIETPNGGVVRCLRSRDDWARIWHQRMAQPQIAVPERLQAVAIDPQRIPESHELGLAADGIESLQMGGERAAHELLESFLTQRGERYQREMSSPLTAFDACSRLSPHLAHGRPA